MVLVVLHDVGSIGVVCLHPHQLCSGIVLHDGSRWCVGGVTFRYPIRFTLVIVEAPDGMLAGSMIVERLAGSQDGAA